MNEEQLLQKIENWEDKNKYIVRKLKAELRELQSKKKEEVILDDLVEPNKKESFVNKIKKVIKKKKSKK